MVKQNRLQEAEAVKPAKNSKSLERYGFMFTDEERAALAKEKARKAKQ